MMFSLSEVRAMTDKEARREYRKVRDIFNKRLQRYQAKTGGLSPVKPLAKIKDIVNIKSALLNAQRYLAVGPFLSRTPSTAARIRRLQDAGYNVTKRNFKSFINVVQLLNALKIDNAEYKSFLEQGRFLFDVKEDVKSNELLRQFR